MIHITELQYKAIYNAFDNDTFGEVDDIEREIEVRDAGLDATLKVGAVAYEGRYGVAYAFYNVELETFIDGGFEVPNDFDPNQFIRLYKQAS